MNHWNPALVCWLFLLAIVFPSTGSAQGRAIHVPGIAPAPLVRLTGVLEARQKPLGATLPLLSVWIAGEPWLFRVAQVEPVFPAYRAAEKLRKVSPLGLRFLAESPVLSTLQNTDMHDRSIVIEGWLRPKAGVLKVRSVRPTVVSSD
jgi:hypothetical protein